MATAVAVGVAQLVVKDLRTDGCYENDACLQHPSAEGGTHGCLECRRIEVGEERWS
jgi:hypothetical protein